MRGAIVALDRSRGLHVIRQLWSAVLPSGTDANSSSVLPVSSLVPAICVATSGVMFLPRGVTLDRALGLVSLGSGVGGEAFGSSFANYALSDGGCGPKHQTGAPWVA
jgi:hypothetical protein